MSKRVEIIMSTRDIIIDIYQTEVLKFIDNFFFLDKLQPYYDDDREPIMDTDDMDSEDDIIMVSNPIAREYHD